MALDLAESSLSGYSLESMGVGGTRSPAALPDRVRKVFPSAQLVQGYGMTEINTIAVSFAGEDYLARPESTGLAMPVTDIKIVKDDKEVAPGEVGEVWMRGPNVMKCYWRDPGE
ncbi:hypothetical protein H0H81_008488 [Sphagnurus paluster]|uniref:AMP-dependent synthetase/ligase domain-containing protein n=1 Tax=Sphagnurus paluster TaxID=117069 RepID=A0A9P7GK10_9AGAR|nr:hypothetical protein H0H81_008488 [Sphagnurus paluster]